jgi:hypothetical protein
MIGWMVTKHVVYNGIEDHGQVFLSGAFFNFAAGFNSLTAVRFLEIEKERL